MSINWFSRQFVASSSVQLRRPTATRTFLTSCTLVLLAAACGGDDATRVATLSLEPGPSQEPVTPAEPTEPEPAPPAAEPPPAPASLYVGATRVFSPEGSQGYLFAVPSLGRDSSVDLSRAAELSDAWVFGNTGADFFTATLFEPTIISWHVTPEGNFEQGPTLSFINQGVTGTYTAASTALYSDEKSYFVDGGSMQVVVWSPRDMVFLKTIELPTPDLPGYTPWAELTVRKDRVLVTVMMEKDETGFTENGNFVRLISIDTATDTVTEVTDDPRCGSLGPAGVASDGTAYFSPWDYHATIRGVFGEGYGSASCGLRVMPAAGSLDQSYEVDLSSLVGGRPAGGMQLLDDQQALLHVWHEELVGATPDNWVDERFEPGYKWYRWRIGSAEATELPDQAPGGEGSAWRVLDGKAISFSNNAEYTETTLIELDDTGRGKPGLVVPGWIVTMLRAY